MMNMMDENQKLRLKWVEIVKQKSPEFWKSVKNEEFYFLQTSRNVMMACENSCKAMAAQRETVEKFYNDYLDDWRKNMELILKSMNEQKRLISDLEKLIVSISSSDNILKAMDDKQCSFDKYLPECKRRLRNSAPMS